MKRPRLIIGLLILGICQSPGQAAESLAEEYLLAGKLTDGEKALQERLQKEPNDDQARFGLGVVQFFQAFERLGNSLYRYGLRTGSGFGPVRPQQQLSEMLPPNPHPEQLTYTAWRQVVQNWVNDLNKAEATLSGINDPQVKLRLPVGRIQVDFFGQGKPVSAAGLLGRFADATAREAAEKFVIGFDRGDVCWLRGYCHFLTAWGELFLAVDGQELFNCTAHLFFEKVESPHAFLQEGPRSEDLDTHLIIDLVALVHQLRLPVKEPERCQAALAHFEAMVGQGKEMWKFILAETDDDHEWVSNPKQKSVVGVAVQQEMIDTWLATLDEVELVLQGKRLLPLWRGTQADRGINLRRVFLQPRTFDPILWFQGTAATPYLEKGTLTKLADPRMLERIDQAFGGRSFIGFAFWFN